MMRTSGLIATFAAATSLATVGVASATAPPTSDPVREAAFEYAQCLRDNGIEDYPDPQVGEGGGRGSRPSCSGSARPCVTVSDIRPAPLR